MIKLASPGVQPGLPASEQRVSGWAALRRDPTCAQEIAVLHALPLLSPSVERWNAKLPAALNGEELAHPGKGARRRRRPLGARGGAQWGRHEGTGAAFDTGPGHCEDPVLQRFYGRWS
jgi:hypothetical protein